MLRRVLPAVLAAAVLAGLPVGWVLMSRDSTATASVRDVPADVTVTVSVGATETVTEIVGDTATATVSQTTTVFQTSIVNQTATTTSHSVTTATAHQTVQLPGSTVLTTLPGGQVIRTVVATPPSTEATPSPSSSSPGETSANAAIPGSTTSGTGSAPVWPYVLGILVLVLAAVIGVLVTPRR
jgi:cobalamin biosynthesis Mg chelatase CobN